MKRFPTKEMGCARVTAAGFASFVAALILTLAPGCSTVDPDQESDIPWNAPQSWEGAPGIPGLDGNR